MERAVVARHRLSAAARPRLLLDRASMEPRHCCRGEYESELSGKLTLASLQWSRGIAAAESRGGSGRAGGGGRASMEPRHCCRGETEQAAENLIAFFELQWSRGIAAAESVAHPAVGRVQWQRASMEPRHCCRGESVTLVSPAFAIEELQWSRGIAAAESGADRNPGRIPPPRFNGAAALLPRRAETRRDSGRAYMGFNGAAALLPRRVQRDALKCSV